MIMSEEQGGANHNSSLPSILSSIVSSGSGSSTSPLSSLQAIGGTAAIAAQKIYLQPQAENDENHQDTVNPISTKSSFLQQVQANHNYGCMVHANSEYEVRLVHGTKQIHWFLLVKMFRSQLPYMTLEIATSDLCDLIPTMRTISESESGNVPHAKLQDSVSHSTTCITDVGSYKGSLHNLCQIADKIVEDMKSYNLVTSNCQHFCNNLLRRIGKKTFPMTVGRMSREDKEKKFDHYSNIISSGIPVLTRTDSWD